MRHPDVESQQHRVSYANIPGSATPGVISGVFMVLTAVRALRTLSISSPGPLIRVDRSPLES